MKLGTDSVLLGAFSKVGTSNNAVDLGTGCGILALMLAQKGVKKITAIESDMHAAMQASYNFMQSPWPEKFEVICSSIHDLRDAFAGKFDLIISNPPYFEGRVPSADRQRNQARQAEGDAETFRYEWFRTASELSVPHAVFSVIFPFSNEQEWLSSAEKAGWFAHELLRVKGRAELDYSRTLVTLKKEKSVNTVSSELIVETDKRGVYTPEYRSFTEDFYLERVFNRSAI